LFDSKFYLKFFNKILLIIRSNICLILIKKIYFNLMLSTMAYLWGLHTDVKLLFAQFFKNSTNFRDYQDFVPFLCLFLNIIDLTFWKFRYIESINFWDIWVKFKPNKNILILQEISCSSICKVDLIIALISRISLFASTFHLS
jgi:hypothetical protein